MRTLGLILSPILVVDQTYGRQMRTEHTNFKQRKEDLTRCQLRGKKEKAGKVKAVSMEEEGGIVAAPCAHAKVGLLANAFREPRTVLQVVEAYGARASYK